MKALLLATGIVMSFTGFAQTALIELDTNVVKLGGQTNLLIQFDYRIDTGEGATVTWPTLEDTLSSAIDILSTGPIDTSLVNPDDPYLFRQRLTMRIAAFDTGFHVIKPLPFDFNGTKVESNAVLLRVAPVQVDLKAESKDIKDIQLVNLTFWERYGHLWWVILILFLLPVVIFVLIKLSKREKKIAPNKETPKVITPAHITALEQLQKLKEKGLWQKGMTKAYHTELTDILRAYIEARFQIPAMEATSAEVLGQLKTYGLAGEHLALLPKLFNVADLVKFAKYKAVPEENESAMLNAFAFVEQTAEVVQAK